MEDSGAILAHISSLKEMLDQVCMHLCSSYQFLSSLDVDLCWRKAGKRRDGG